MTMRTAPTPTAKSGDAEGDDGGEQGRSEERRRHDGVPARVVLFELRVGESVAGLEPVAFDRVGLGVGREGPVDRIAGEAVGVIGDGDVLVRELVPDDEPGDHTGDREHGSGDDHQHADGAQCARGRP